MTKYKFTPEMAEISGLGGSYEENCRKMLIAGLEFWDQHPELRPEWKGFKGVFGLLIAKNEDAQRLKEVMINACDDAPTSAMYHAVVDSLLWIRQYGWDNYVKRMKGEEK